MNRIRKLLIFIIMAFAVFLFVGCTPSESLATQCESQVESDCPYAYNSTEITQNEDVPLVSNVDNEENIGNGFVENTDVYEWCYCGLNRMGEEARQPTPPLNIHETYKTSEVRDFVRDFELVHEWTFRQVDTEWIDGIILWPDEILRDFSFVSLFYDGDTIFSTAEVLLAIDELLPVHAIFLDLQFAHHRFPLYGVIFTDENGGQRRMLIHSLAYVGCIYHFHLVPIGDYSLFPWAIWEDEATHEHEVKDIEPAQDDVTFLRTDDDLIEFIIRAEQVYRDIIYGGASVAGWYWDEKSDGFMRGHLEEAPDLWVEISYGHGFYIWRFRVLPSLGYTSIADLNATLHEYWSEDFQIPSGEPWVENNFFVEIDGVLYYLPPEACGGWAVHWATHLVSETAQFETIEQTDESTTVRAETYITAVGTLYRGALQWEIAGGRIVARYFDWGYIVE